MERVGEFFFSSRRRHTRFTSDWSSDVCSSDLWGMNPQEAVEPPRFSSLSVPNSFYPHNYLAGQLALEDTFPQSTLDALTNMGHHVTCVGTCGMGATVTTRNPTNGVFATGADPRRSCYAIGW